MTAPAIEATYRGYRFRSRLEARWAVAFDCLGLTWKYETQGYLVGADKRPYLPDFWVRDFEAWVEVKGDPELLDHSLAVDAVSPDGGLPGFDSWGNRNLLILGDIPDPTEPHGWMHHLIWQRGRDGCCEGLCDCVFARRSTVAFRHHSQRMMEMAVKKTGATGGLQELYPTGAWPRGSLLHIGRDEGMLRSSDPRRRDLVTAQPCGSLFPDQAVAAAYRAARSARFEHGENPEPPEPARGTPEPKPAGDAIKARLNELLERRTRGKRDNGS